MMPMVRTAVALSAMLSLALLVNGQQKFCVLRSQQVCAGTFHVYLENQTPNPLQGLFDNTSGVRRAVSPWFVDMDADGDTDLVVGCKYVWSCSGSVEFYENVGDIKNPRFENRSSRSNPFDGVTVNHSIDQTHPVVADFDNDTLLDLLITGSPYTDVRHYKNVGNKTHANFMRVQNSPFARLEAIPDGGISVFPVDIDGDEDLDIFTGGHDAPGYIRFFENTGSAAQMLLTQRTGADHPLDGANVDNDAATVLFHDVDNDGDFDFLAGNGYGTLLFYMNVGNSLYPTFMLMTGQANPFLGVSVFTNSAPAFADLEGDGTMDLYIGNDDGELELNTLTNSATRPVFTPLPVSANPLYAVDVGLNAQPAFADLDCDGDQDLLATSSDAGTVRLMLNTGSASQPVYHQPEELIDCSTSQTLRLSTADVDGDNDTDIIISTSAGNISLIENNGTRCNASFRWVGSSGVFANVTPGSRPNLAFVDLDADSDLDLVIGTDNANSDDDMFYAERLLYFENAGNRTVANFVAANESSNPFTEIVRQVFLDPAEELQDEDTAPAFGDFDGDGDQDLIVGSYAGSLFTFENQGNATHADFSTVPNDKFTDFDGVDVGFTSAPTTVDLEGGGTVDIVVGNEDGEFSWFANGRCIPQFPCSNHGGCVNDVWEPTCTCFTGFTDDQCNDCVDGFFGTDCELCPGGGTVAVPTLSKICAEQGTCDDGMGGTGNCTCNTYFDGDSCDKGECPAGYSREYNATSGLYQCDPCAPGTAKLRAGDSDICSSCEPGFYSDGEGSTSCKECKDGYFVDVSGADSCSACAKNTYALPSGAGCAPCGAESGQATKAKGALFCNSCLKGFYNSEASTDDGHVACKACVTGMDCSESQATLSLLPLKKGYWRVENDTAELESCPFSGACVGTSSKDYDESSNSTAGNILCADGHRGPLCAVCDADYYFSTAANKCKSCAASAYDPAAITVMVVVAIMIAALVQQMFFSSKDGMRRLERATSSVRSMSVDAERSSLSELGDSVIGQAKEAAQDKLDEMMDEQEKRRLREQRLASLRNKVKITLSFIQILSNFPWVLDIRFPDVYESFLSVVSFVNLDFIQVLPSDCAQRTDYVDELILMTVFPFVVAGILFASFLFQLRQLKLQSGRGPHVTHAKAKMQALYSQLFLLLTYLIFPSVSTKIFRVFSCHELSDESSYLRADYSINCDSDRYLVGLVWASLMIVVYPFGIPALYLAVLFRHRRQLNPSADAVFTQEPDDMPGERAAVPVGTSIMEHARAKWEGEGDKETGGMDFKLALQLAKVDFRDQEYGDELGTFEFLFGTYEPRVWYWEVLECVRRLALTGLMVFFLEGTAVQAVIGMLIAFVSIEAYAKLEPFILDSDDMLAEIIQWSTMFILFGALLIRVDVTEDDEQSQVWFGAVLIAITLVGPTIGFVLAMRESLLELKDNVDEAKALHEADETSKEGRDLKVDTDSGYREEQVCDSPSHSARSAHNTMCETIVQELSPDPRLHDSEAGLGHATKGPTHVEMAATPSWVLFTHADEVIRPAELVSAQHGSPNMEDAEHDARQHSSPSSSRQASARHLYRSWRQAQSAPARHEPEDTNPESPGTDASTSTERRDSAGGESATHFAHESVDRVLSVLEEHRAESASGISPRSPHSPRRVVPVTTARERDGASTRTAEAACSFTVPPMKQTKRTAQRQVMRSPSYSGRL